MVQIRLERELYGGQGISDQQYGFRKGRSTVQSFEQVLQIASESPEKWTAVVTEDI